VSWLIQRCEQELLADFLLKMGVRTAPGFGIASLASVSATMSIGRTQQVPPCPRLQQSSV
jgi:hypothetical protein